MIRKIDEEKVRKLKAEAARRGISLSKAVREKGYSKVLIIPTSMIKGEREWLGGSIELQNA